MATPSEDLQKVVFEALIADPSVSAIVGDRIVDGRPDAYPCCTFGPRDTVFEDAECIIGRTETLQIDCWVVDGGRTRGAAALADAVKAALHRQDFALDTHALVSLRVTAQRAFLDADGLTGHGVVTIEADIEEL
ncbi:uncharacterized protein DUF3168 [Palleronia aestuarii]|uniref:Uncharacterized protein DUF3168 n=1 Tax=Palleronia aestuarii TaxID=568105 RepID=A0A2W7P311_9RHOB|nr:DUF3168 domain-containing protein [Palleronia aestuarii]PZX19816.1 uncharacterized protein DUF3168 [Palleronia aestuarii]